MNPSNVSPNVPEFNFPICDLPDRKHWELKMSWDFVIEQTEWQREFYMKHYDSPERRLRNKNPEPFHLPRNP